MNTTQAKTSIKNLIAESFSLNPTALITLFEIDVSDIGVSLGVIYPTEVSQQRNTIFRFHNNVNLTSQSLFWAGKEYIAAPIFAEGFDINARGSPSTPKLSITVSDEGISTLSILKDRINELGDLSGSKVTRIRTFAKFIDAANFINGIPPKDFFPDPFSEISRDIFIIDKKSSENKTHIEYELVPSFEVGGISLPGRICTQDNCVFLYRGQGCLYEFASRKNVDIHEDGNLPYSAPPIATSFNESISSIVTGVPFTDKGEYNPGEIYNKGDYVYTQNLGLKYYFVSNISGNNSQPPSDNWVNDECSHKQVGCKLRWQNIGDGSLPFGGFPSINRFK